MKLLKRPLRYFLTEPWVHTEHKSNVQSPYNWERKNILQHSAICFSNYAWPSRESLRLSEFSSYPSRIERKYKSPVLNHKYISTLIKGGKLLTIKCEKITNGGSVRVWKETLMLYLMTLSPDFYLNKQSKALIIKIYSVIKLYMFRASSLPIIRSFLLYIRHR